MCSLWFMLFVHTLRCVHMIFQLYESRSQLISPQKTPMKNILPPLLRGLEPRPFHHNSSALTTELSPLPQGSDVSFFDNLYESRTHRVSLQRVDGVVESEPLVVRQHAVFFSQAADGLAFPTEPRFHIGVDLIVQLTIVAGNKQKVFTSPLAASF